MAVLYYDAPVGWLRITENGSAVTELSFVSACGTSEATPLLSVVAEQLTSYFAGARRMFEIPLAPRGTPFQLAVWRALQTIPYGEVRTYREIATLVGDPKACRAVGMANHRNPIPILIPCHRVIGSDGRLTGYAGGLERKEFLLKTEGFFDSATNG